MSTRSATTAAAPAAVPVIADLQIVCPFRVYDINTGSYIYSYLDASDPGDLPPDIGCLPALGFRSIRSDSGPVLYIDTEVTP